MSILLNSCLFERADTCGITAYPFSFAGWVWTTAITNQVWLGFGDTDAVPAAYGYLRDPADSDSGAYRRSLSPATAAADGTTTQYAGGKWEHVTVVFTSNTSMTMYLDGGGATTNTTSVTFDAGLDNTCLGAVHNDSSYVSIFAGYVAEMAIWDIALDTADVTSLAAGTYPNQIRPDNCKAYWDCTDYGDGVVIGASDPIADSVGSYTLVRNVGGAATGSSKHPTMINATASTTPVEVRSIRQLVTFAGNKVFYGPNATSLTELTAASATIDCTVPLKAQGGFGKVFVANEANKVVLSFSDTKLATADVGSSALPTRGMQLTGGTSGAKMVVDFLSDSTSTAYVYGLNITTIAFTSIETVTGIAASSVSFTSTEPSNTGPHTFSWTPYGNDTATYGTMPDKSNLVALYRGRMVVNCLSAPHNWHMSRVANPFDWLYVVNDPLSPISGNNADAGEVGDVPVAYIPQSDDYMVFGCAGSVQIMAGDPAFGGSIDELTNMTGVFGAHSWCKDEAGNLYFYGTNGLYKMAGGRSKPENISVGKLPKLASDWSAASSVERVVCTYDAERTGIILSKTVLTTGVNYNYFFDLKMDGLFKEEYPANGSIYSSINYKGDTIAGGFDGYLREFLDTAKSDDNGATDSAITSYVGWVEVLNDTGDDDGTVIKSITVDTAGGASSGGFTDTDTVDIAIFTATTAEECMEDMIDGATAFLTVALVSVGRQAMIRQNIRGNAIGFKLTNSVLSESWAVNKIIGNVESVG